jgi:predicted GIY-YIG superfamily endonuclease
LSERTAVYRLYDADDTLLYIGMTGNPDGRFAAHESTKPWWSQVARRSFEWHDSRELAEAAEDEAIRTEYSLYNVAGSPWAPKPRELGPHEIGVSDLKVRFPEVIEGVRFLRRSMIIVRPTRDRKPQAALVPFELADAAEAAGGMDAAVAILRKTAQ